MKTIILAAGFGTRLGQLAENKAKSLIEVNEKPILEHILNKLSKIENMEEIFIITNNKFHKDFLEWKNDFKYNQQIILINNNINSPKETLGAIGDLKNALKQISHQDILILAGDSLFEFDLNQLIKLSKERDSSTIALKVIENTNQIKKYSCVKINDQKKITYFEEKPKNPQTNLISTAFYFLKQKDLQKLIDHNFENSDNMGGLIEFLYKNSEVYGNVFQDFWADIGSPEELEKAREF
jgi:glucose-1-phosphate thymidylyltransferase